MDFLICSRRLVGTLSPVELSNWPAPSYPISVRKVGNRLVRALQGNSDVKPLSLFEIDCCLDEWLTSADNDNLSVVQRAICGTMLLELFRVKPDHSRVSPAIASAFKNIQPAIEGKRINREGLQAIERAIGQLLHVKAVISLSEEEIASLQWAQSLLRAVIDRDELPNGDALKSYLAIVVELEDEWTLEVMRTSGEAFVACERLSAQARSVVRAALAPVTK